MFLLKRILNNIKMSSTWFHLRGYISQYPLIYLPYARLQFPGQALQKNTQLLVEGYCRSGNSFFAEAFMWAQEQPVKIAWNLHIPGAVIEAERRALATVVMIRKPEEVAISQYIINPQLSFKDILRGYIRYYKCVLPYRDKIVITTIYEIRNDLGAVIERINSKYGACYTKFEHTEANEKAVYNWMNEKARGRKGGKMSKIDIHYSGYATKDRMNKRTAVIQKYHLSRDIIPLEKEAMKIYNNLTTSEQRVYHSPKFIVPGEGG